MNSFDIDGVIYINKDVGGVYPGAGDVIITGRSFEEQPETERMLHARGIYNKVYYNPLRFEEKTRASSGSHKAFTLLRLLSEGHDIKCHFEDDEVQAAVIQRYCPRVTVVMLQHSLTEKENVRHDE